MNRTWILFSAVAITTTLFGGNGYDGRFDLYTGWRQDDFVWSIPGFHGFPNVSTEIDYRLMQSAMVGARGYLAGWDRIYTRLEGDFGIIFQGKPSKTVFAGNNRSDTITKIQAEHGGNKVFDVKGALGFHVLPNCGPVDIALCGGFAFQGQNFRMSDPCVTEAPFGVCCFCIDKLSNHYHVQWKSGFVGLDNYWNISGCWKIGIQAELHWAAYRGCGTWDWEGGRREDIPNLNRHEYFHMRYVDSASGWGQLINGTINYHAWKGWSFGLIGGYRFFRTRPGEHCVECVEDHHVPQFLRNIVTLPRHECKLNRIHWRSFFLSFNFECQF
jgi:hypothetical protein